MEELRLVPAKLEQKAPIPDCKMKVVTDVEHHGHGDGEEISQIDVGKPMRLEFTLMPESGKIFYQRNMINNFNFRRLWSFDS